MEPLLTRFIRIYPERATPAGMGLRLELLGCEIEGIRTFHVLSQLNSTTKAFSHKVSRQEVRQMGKFKRKGMLDMGNKFPLLSNHVLAQNSGTEIDPHPNPNPKATRYHLKNINEHFSQSLTIVKVNIWTRFSHWQVGHLSSSSLTWL